MTTLKGSPAETMKPFKLAGLAGEISGLEKSARKPCYQPNEERKTEG